MLIAGGVYVERCVAPDMLQLLGSAGRAALALSAFRSDIDLHCYHPESLWPDLDVNFSPWGIRCHPHPSTDRVSFSYLFPLDRPFMQPALSPQANDIIIEGSEILTFGCVEGQFVPHGGSVVFDVQGSATSFKASGGRAERLALVLNAEEARFISQQSELADSAASLMQGDEASVLVVKDGPRGALVFERGAEVNHIPPYRSASLYKIGSGDIFSAVFAHHWLSGTPAALAADHASRMTSAYVEAPVLPLRASGLGRTPIAVNMPEKVLLVAAQQSTSSAWLTAIAGQALERLGVRQVEILTLTELMNSDRHHLGTEPIIVFVPDRRSADILGEQLDPLAEKLLIHIDQDQDLGSSFGRARAFTDLSQAVYESCWTTV